MSLPAFAKALAEFQAVIPHIGKDQTAKVKTKQGGEYTYDFTDLSSIAAKALPLLSKHGLSWTARPTMSEHGFVLAYSLLHVEGHREDGFYPLPDPAHSSSQEIGSAITYARRYTLCASTGITPGGEDDDGQAASKARAAHPAPAQPDPVKAVKARVWQAAKARGITTADDLAIDYAATHDGQTLDSATVEELTAYAETLEQVAA